MPAIEELRSLSDPDIVTGTPGNGVCLIGNSEVFDRIRGKAQAEFAQIFTRVKMPRQYRSSRITKEDVRSLFPAVSDEKELAVLLGVARSVYSIRTAQEKGTWHCSLHLERHLALQLFNLPPVPGTEPAQQAINAINHVERINGRPDGK